MSLANGIAVRLRSDHQRGLFVPRPAHKEEILIRYDGPILDHPTRYSVQIDDNRHIYGTPESNAYLNHSCAPNSYVDWKGVCLRALRDITAGEELTCNYLTTRLGDSREVRVHLRRAKLLRGDQGLQVSVGGATARTGAVRAGIHEKAHGSREDCNVMKERFQRYKLCPSLLSLPSPYSPSNVRLQFTPL